MIKYLIFQSRGLPGLLLTPMELFCSDWSLMVLQRRQDHTVLLKSSPSRRLSFISVYSLHLYISRTFIFSLHVEKDELLGTLEFDDAEAAFIHLSFMCDLKYPKVILFL